MNVSIWGNAGEEEEGPCEVSYAHIIGFIDRFAVYNDEYSNN